MQLGKRITLPGKNDWYAVVVYGDGSSYYWKGKDAANQKNGKSMNGVSL